LDCNRGAQRSSHRPEYRLIHYEKLVAEPETELSRICAFLGYKFVPAMLAPDAQTASNSRVRAHQKGVNLERLEKWREQLSADDVALTEWAAGAVMQGFGYQPAGGAPSQLRIPRARGFAVLDAIRKQLVEFPGVWYYLMQPTRIAAEEYWKHQRDWKQEGNPVSRPWRLTRNVNAQ
jgi:hypothetical protein